MSNDHVTHQVRFIISCTPCGAKCAKGKFNEEELGKADEPAEGEEFAAEDESPIRPRPVLRPIPRVSENVPDSLCSPLDMAIPSAWSALRRALSARPLPYLNECNDVSAFSREISAMTHLVNDQDTQCLNDLQDDLRARLTCSLLILRCV